MEEGLWKFLQHSKTSWGKPNSAKNFKGAYLPNFTLCPLTITRPSFTVSSSSFPWWILPSLSSSFSFLFLLFFSFALISSCFHLWLLASGSSAFVLVPFLILLLLLLLYHTFWVLWGFWITRKNAGGGGVLEFLIHQKARIALSLEWEREGSVRFIVGAWRVGHGGLMEARLGKASEIGVRARDWWGLGKVFWWGGARCWGGVDDWGKRALRVSHGVSFEVAQMKPNHSSKPSPNSNFKPTLNPNHSGERSQDQSGICLLFLHFVLIEVL